jgi:hypothetical protein
MNRVQQGGRPDPAIACKTACASGRGQPPGLPPPFENSVSDIISLLTVKQGGIDHGSTKKQRHGSSNIY